ncbi:hypothetical protein MTO96_023115 [Rhipicephalus appendiculatus]
MCNRQHASLIHIARSSTPATITDGEVDVDDVAGFFVTAPVLPWFPDVAGIPGSLYDTAGEYNLDSRKPEWISGDDNFTSHLWDGFQLVSSFRTGTSCPTINELRSERHFNLWDEKLAQALRRSVLGAPKTERESWHVVTDNIHAFTAFLASTPKRVIYIVSIVRSHQSNANKTKIQHPPLVCVIRTSNGTIQSEAHIREVWTWLNPDFVNALIVCPPLDPNVAADEEIKVAVAVRGCAEDTLRWLQLHHVPERAPEKCCSVCVRPTYGSSTSLWKIVEFVVHYMLMGVSKFYFYDLDMSSELKLLLAWLQSTGVDVTLVPFKLIAEANQVHAEGQMPGLYDCIFRSMSQTEYYIHVDFDELIIPRRNSSIPAIVEEEERKSDGSLGSLVLPTRYHCAEYPLNLKYSQVDHLPLQTRLFTYHSQTWQGAGFSKCIARSRAVYEAGVHDVSVLRHGYSKRRPNSLVAFTSHYRRCCNFPPDSAVAVFKVNIRTSCPTKNEHRSARHFSLWDEKLAEALRQSGLAEPKTEKESWHAVTDNIHAFTAFLTSTPERAIYVTSLVRRQEPNAEKTQIRHPPLVCLIRTSQGTIQREVRIREVYTWLNPDFVNALIVCQPPDQNSTADENMQVAVAVRDSDEQSSRWLQLHRVPERAKEKCCAVCVRPTYGFSMSLWKIVEFIVHYRLMGVSKFYFYDHDMPLDMKLLLAWLQSKGVDVTLVPFNLIADPADVHAYGQIPGLYDCIYRSMSETEYYIHVDLDELIIPRQHSSISDMLEEEERKHDGLLGSIVVPARYHCAEYPLNMQYSEVYYVPLQTRLFVYHSKVFNRDGVTKYIARSRTVYEAAVHDVMVHHNGYSVAFAESSLVLMNHYRRCCKFPTHSAMAESKADLRNFIHVADYSFVKLSARIDRDELVMSLRKLIK